MIEVFTAALGWFKDTFDMLLKDGGYIGKAVVFMPVFSWLVRAVRSIIKK